MEKILKVENASFSYDKQNKVLKDISFEVERGEYIAIIGHNGSGKSTLAKLLNGLLVADSGEVTVANFSAKDKKSLFEVRKRVGVVFQNPDNQLVASIVEDDVAFGPENLGIERKEIGERIDFALKAVGMEEFRKVSPTRLSGGQKQRIAIAGVLALKPEILVLDESTAMLDPQGRKEVLEVVEKLNEEEKVTVIAITHYMEEAVRADRILVINHGEIVMSGTPKEVFARAEELREIGLELPPVCQIVSGLIKKGLQIEKEILTEEELLEALCELLQKN
ncbi:MAG: energy-coupling factor transporter ATPase [Clostridia bacterium]|nr:energy-coupling factor transporter ATPase [Clostridia bacterium]